ncbi:MAG: hypothetical protein IPG50_30105 [Myxococcales bacterium]|nr:hypothetical protein [Myxococcales bacterium]
MSLRSTIAAALAGTLFAAPHIAYGGDKAACSASYTNAQRSQRRGSLLEARRELAVCLRECSAAVHVDCARWVDEVERAIPSLIVSVRRGGADVATARIVVDGTIPHSAGLATELDPGPHRIVVTDGATVREETVVLAEGEKGRRLTVELPAPSEQSAAAPAPQRDGAPQSNARVPTAAIALGSVGVLGLASFGTFGLLGAAKYSDLETCRPGCAPNDVTTTRTYYAVADVSLAVGVVALGAAAIVFLSRASHRGAALVPSAPTAVTF